MTPGGRRVPALFSLLTAVLSATSADEPSAAHRPSANTNAALAPEPLDQRFFLAIDPTFHRGEGLSVQLATVTKEPRSPLIKPTLPWEVTFAYLGVVWAPERKAWLVHWAGALCCSGGPAGGPPRIWDGDCANSSYALELPAPTIAADNCTCFPGTDYKCAPESCVIGSPGGVTSYGQCASLCAASAAKDPLNGCLASSFKAGAAGQPGTCLLKGTWARPIARPGWVGCQCREQGGRPAQPLRDVIQCSAGTGTAPPLDGVYYAESMDGIVFTKPSLHQMQYGGMSLTNVLQLNESYGPASAPWDLSGSDYVLPLADGNKMVMRDPHDPDPNHRYKMVGNFQRNDSIIPTSNSGVAGFDAAGYAPFENKSWKNYHYGTASSADGVQWHSYSDVSMQIYARADTANNVVYDSDVQQYMIFTRLDCGVVPFGNNPSLAGCAVDGYGLRRSGRSVSKKFGDGANWSHAEMCAHGEAGDEQYTLVPWRDPSWRPGMWLALGSFLNTTDAGGTYHVRSELLSSGDYGKSWTRLAPRTAFIPFGTGLAFDSHGIYAAPPVAEPQNLDCLRVYYRGSDGPHGNGHSTGGLAYVPAIPAGVGGVGVLHTGALDTSLNLSDIQAMWVECELGAADRLVVKLVGVSHGLNDTEPLSTSLGLDEVEGDRYLDSSRRGFRRKYWVHWDRQLDFLQPLEPGGSSSGRELQFHLHGGSFFAFGFGMVRGKTVQQVQTCTSTRSKSDDGLSCRLYPMRDDPFANPATERNWIKPPRALMNRTIAGVQLGGSDPTPQLRDDLNASGLGSAWKPTFSIFDMAPTELNQSLHDMKARDEWLLSVWDYIPGDDDNCKDNRTHEDSCEFHLKRSISDLTEAALGENYCGMENGEQDGRYQTAFNGEVLSAKGGGASSAAAEQRKSYLHFMRFSDRIADDLGNKLIGVNSLFNVHYFAHAGFHTMLGQETAELLPSPQVAYAFHRGAAKQYGAHIWGMISVFARGRSYKKCWKAGGVASNDPCLCNEEGTSLSLMRRLMYTLLQYGSRAFSFEMLAACSAPFGPGKAGGTSCCGDPHPGPPSSPIAQMQVAGLQFAEEQTTAQLTHVAQVAIFLDFFSGYQPPRSLYDFLGSYERWGLLDWSANDFATHGVLDLIYPGYDKSSYYADETGFQTPTPFSDGADVLLSDATLQLLSRYPVLVATTSIVSAKAEVADKLSQYVKNGGLLTVTASTLASLPGGLLGVSVAERLMGGVAACIKSVAPGPVKLHLLNGGQSATVDETAPAKACRLLADPAVGGHLKIAATAHDSTALAYSLTVGRGTLLVLLSTAIASSPQVQIPIEMNRSTSSNHLNQPLPNPYPLLKSTEALLSDIFKSQVLFSPGEPSGQIQLAHIINRVSSTEYLMQIANTRMQEQTFNVTSSIGPIASITEVMLADAHIAVPGVPGFAPAGSGSVDRGHSSATAIAGGDIRVFKIKLAAKEACELLLPVPAEPNPSRVAIKLDQNSIPDVRQAILLRPSFRQHFDSVVVDWRYLESRTATAIAEEGRWLFRRNISVIVDFSSGLNLYPDLRLVKDAVDEYERSMSRIYDVLIKMSVLHNSSTTTAASAMYSNQCIVRGCHGVEDNYNTTLQEQDIQDSYINLTFAFPHIVFNMRTGPWMPTNIENGQNFLKACGSPPNFKLAVTLASMAAAGVMPAGLKTGSAGIYLAAAPSRSLFNARDKTQPPWSTYGRLSSLVVNSLVWVNLGWTLGHNSGRSEGEQSHGMDPIQIVLDASLPDAADGLNAMEDAEYEEAAALSLLLKSPVPGWVDQEVPLKGLI